MFVDPRAHEILVASRTELGGTTRNNPGIIVRVMTTRTAHSALAHGMVTRVAELCPYVGVTLDAELRRRIHVGKARTFEFAQGEPLSIMGVVAIATDQTGLRMPAEAPLQVGIPARRMAGQTIRAAGMANIRHGLTLGVKASTPVAALAVRMVRGHPGGPVNRLVAILAFVGPHRHSSGDGFGAPRTHGLPGNRRARESQNRTEKQKAEPAPEGREALA